MDEVSLAILDMLRRDEKIRWIVDQLVGSFAEGVTESANKAEFPSRYEDGALARTDISQKDRIKRENYETSRPYTDLEKLELEEFALEQMFVAIPSMQDSTAHALADLGSQATAIEFIPPDEEERMDRSYTYSLSRTQSQTEELGNRLKTFVATLRNDNP